MTNALDRFTIMNYAETTEVNGGSSVVARCKLSLVLRQLQQESL